MYQQLVEMAKECFQISLDHGFWGDDVDHPTRDYGEGIALLHSEIDEAYIAYENDCWFGKDGVYEELADVYIRWADFVVGFGIFIHPHIPQEPGEFVDASVEFPVFTNKLHVQLSKALEAKRHDNGLVEDGAMADLLILIVEWFYHQEIDLIGIVRTKMDYNKTRPRKHGKAF